MADVPVQVETCPSGFSLGSGHTVHTKAKATAEAHSVKKDCGSWMRRRGRTIRAKKMRYGRRCLDVAHWTINQTKDLAVRVYKRIVRKSEASGLKSGRTLYTCSGCCVLVTIRRSVVCVRFQSRTVTMIGHAMRSSYPSLPVSPFGSARCLVSSLPFPPCCSGLGSTDNPRRWVISVLVCLWAGGAATGLVPFDHSGFYPVAAVVLVACTPVAGWSLVGTCLCYQDTVCSWRAMAVLPANEAFSPTLLYACHWSG